MSKDQLNVTILVASNNAHKMREFREIFDLAGAGDVRLVTPAELGLALDPEENATTYSGNALIKARAFAAAAAGMSVDWVMADDSGIEVDALGGQPGLHSAPYQKAAPGGDGCAALLAEMRDVPDAQRGARFRSVIALLRPGADAALRDAQLFEGVVEGTLTRERRGEHGFGYDPIFFATPTQSMAELSSEEKHAISHRGRSVRAALAAIRQAAGQTLTDRAAQSTGSALDLAYVREIKARHEQALLKFPNVLSVGVAEHPMTSKKLNRGYVISVGASEIDARRNGLPDMLEGVPVMIKRTGAFKPR